jgi:uncharacterized membrane protein YgdD (TMEM256/DUF423 family)
MPSFDWFTRLAIVIAGLLGAAGIAAAAGATHTGDTRLLGALALVALTQAPAILGLTLLAGRSIAFRLATAGIALGAVVFSVDIAMRHFTGNGLFPMSAPLGGILMIAGWLAVAVAGATSPRNR